MLESFPVVFDTFKPIRRVETFLSPLPGNTLSADTRIGKFRETGSQLVVHQRLEKLVEPSRWTVPPFSSTVLTRSRVILIEFDGTSRNTRAFTRLQIRTTISAAPFLLYFTNIDLSRKNTKFLAAKFLLRFLLTREIINNSILFALEK